MRPAMYDVTPALGHLLLYDVTAMTTDDVNWTNGTTAGAEKPLGLYITYNTMVTLVVIIIMFSMGTGVTLKHLKTILVRPVGPIIGFVCQSLIMPAVCTGYALALSLPDNIALGMVLTGSCPGGTVSNIITFWSRADSVLSVCMTTISTTLAVGFLPLNMFIYSRFWIDDMTDLPYGNMVFTVIYVWVAVIIGYLVGWKWPKSVPYFTRIGSIVALLIILAAGLVQARLYPELFDLTWQTYVAGWTMPIIGFAIGSLLALIFCLKHKQRLAIGYETGIQNTALALTVIAISFPSSYESSYYSQFTILYTTVQIIYGFGMVLAIWIYHYIRYRELPWAKKDSFGVMEDGLPQLGIDHHEHVTIDSDGPQLVSVNSTTSGMTLTTIMDSSSSDDKASSTTSSSTPSSTKHWPFDDGMQNGHI